uniref:probable inactive leucine-rich repeat receptor-like protein kinase At3g03770 isoform X2 n=1 Tax=Erigeron canadensis TaxID=72917 RepID=UPI001CB93BA7|nr:probable inactive leucine-rich repeat receptor-like protein kinase At3g03770 isoform X2 [Erigeron canadensis]
MAITVLIVLHLSFRLHYYPHSYIIFVIWAKGDGPEAKADGPKSWFILLETLVGPIVTGKGEAFLLNEMKSFGSQDGRQRIVDPVVLTTSSQESLSIVISITNKCISSDAGNRSLFEDVLLNL